MNIKILEKYIRTRKKLGVEPTWKGLKVFNKNK